MTDKVRVGVIGTSYFPDLVHLPFLKSHAGAITTSICGRNRTRAEELAQKHAIPNVFTDYRDMLGQGNLDAVIVAAPDELHYAMTMAALDAGLHVLCEKPMAINLEQANAMLVKAESAGVKHMINFTYRWMPQFRHLQRLVQEGYIGKCYNINVQYLADYARNSNYQWKWDREHGLGALGDLGSHMIDMAQWLVGNITRVQASLKSEIPRPHPEGRSYEQANEIANLTVQFANGAMGTIYVTAIAMQGSRGQVHKIMLHGDKGSLELENDWGGYTVRGIHDDEPSIVDLPIPDDILQGIDPNASGWDQFFKVFTTQSAGTRLIIDSILAGKSVTPSFLEGMRAQAVMEAALKSDRTGCWVDVY